MTKKSMLWLLVIVITVPLFIIGHDDPKTTERYELETAAFKACRNAVRARADVPDRADFKIGWRQIVDPKQRTVTVEGRVGLETVSGDTVAHAYRCIYDGATHQAQLLELREGRSRLGPLR